MRWRSREDKFKKQSNFSASKKLVAQATSWASDLPFQAQLATYWLQKSRLFVNDIKHSNHLRCSKAMLQGIMIINDAKSYTVVLKTVKRLLKQHE